MKQDRDQSDIQVLTRRISTILEEAGIFIAIEPDKGNLVLSGEVESAENRQAAMDVASAVATPAGFGVVDGLEVLEMSPDSAFAEGSLPLADEPWASEVAGAPHDPNRSEPEMDPDFTDDIGTTNPELAASEAVPYYPSTDPIVRPSSGEEHLEILSGFGPGRIVDDPDADPNPTDDELAQKVASVLRRDALTTDLDISIMVQNGVVRLRGEVPAPEDASAAEAIAGDVPGVVEVREELTTSGILP